VLVLFKYVQKQFLKGAETYGRIANELNEFLDSHGYKDVNEIVGLAHKKLVKEILEQNQFTSCRP